MAEPIIRVEGLGKRYTLRHEAGGARYRRLSEDLVDAVRRPLARLRGTAPPPAATQEEFWALRDVSFDVHQGEVLGIIGRNGAGKSTLLKILSRITEPSEGRVTLRGRVASLLEVGTGFHPELTGRENIYLNGAILGMTRAEITRKFDEIVAFAEVERFLDTPVKRYSSGMYLRLAFAVAAHLDPEILIVDEVLAVGDAEFQRRCLGKMKDVVRTGRTVLFVSHNMNAVLGLCGNTLLLEGGRLQEAGPPAVITARYLSSSTASYAALPRERGRSAGKRPIVELEALDLSAINMARSGDAASIGLTISVQTPVQEVLFGIGFNNPLGSRVATIMSDGMNGQRTSFQRAGVYRITVRLSNLMLWPSEYTVDVGIRRGDKEIIQDVHAAATLRILPPEFAPAYMYDSYATSLLSSKWKMHKDQICIDAVPEQ